MTFLDRPPSEEEKLSIVISMEEDLEKRRRRTVNHSRCTRIKRRLSVSGYVVVVASALLINIDQ